MLTSSIHAEQPPPVQPSCIITKLSQLEKALIPLFLIHQFPSVCRTGKRVSTYKRWVYNSSQSDSNLLADYTYANIVILPVIDTEFSRHQYDVVV